MNKEELMTAYSGLNFFGTMTASATHELKNALAIISENAGLLNDLVAFSNRSNTPLSNDRIEKMAATLTRQVSRTDVILKTLNRFSHSIHHEVGKVDLEDTVRFVVVMASRLLEMMGVSVKFHPQNEPAVVETHLFYLETLLWHFIKKACEVTDTSKNISITIKKVPFPSVWFSIGQPGVNETDFFSSITDIRLLSQLKITAKLDSDKNRFGIVWQSQN